MTLEELTKIFEWGVNYGLFLAETERDSEDLLDAVGCMVYSQKYNVPSAIAPRRRPHSEEWRKAMRSGLDDFIRFMATMKFESDDVVEDNQE